MSTVEIQQMNHLTENHVNDVTNLTNSIPYSDTNNIVTNGIKNGTEENKENFNITIVAPGCDSFELEVSSIELVQDMHQILMDRENTCHRTCFSLHLDGQVLDNFAELRSIESLKDNSKITVVEEIYSTREAKNHVKHVQDLLRSIDMSDSYQGKDMMSLSFMNTILTSAILPNSKRDDKESSAQSQSLNSIEVPDYILPTSMTNVAGGDSPGSNSNNYSISLLWLYPSDKESTSLRCLQSLNYSIWNPPPPNRRLQGDLLYLSVLTMQNKRYHITGCPKGFFINQSTDETFNPRPNVSCGQHSACFNHSLIDLLKLICPIFKRNFEQLLRRRSLKHPLERIPCPYQIFPWLVPLTDHGIDPCKREDPFCSKMAYEENLPGQTRDWNEELQSSRELTHKNLMERIVRERAIFKSYSDFVASATRAACAVVDGNIMPINPGEDLRQQMFIWNNMFFSLGFDVKDHYKEFGGDAAAYAATAADLNGISALMNHNVDGLYALGTVIIDYRGYRVTAQTIIPGILEKEQEQSVVYGSIDFGKTIATNEEYAKLLDNCASLMKIRPHRVVDANGDAKLLHSSVECKGIKGNDQRHYLLDLLRSSPPDLNFMPEVVSEEHINQEVVKLQFPRQHLHKMPVLRHELVEIFVETRYITFLRIAARQLQMKKSQFAKQNSHEEKDIKELKTFEELTAADSLAETSAVDEEIQTVKQILDNVSKTQTTTSNASEETLEDTTLEVIQKAAVSVGSLSNNKFYMAFNPDVYQSNIKTPDEDCAELEQDKTLARDICDFVLLVQIPRFVLDCVEQRIIPADGRSLVDAMHQNGINVRYLGVIYEQFKEKSSSMDYLQFIAISEILIRAAKHKFKAHLQAVESMNLATGVAHFINCFLGSCPQPHTTVNNDEILRLTKRRTKNNKKSKSATNKDSSSTATVDNSMPWLQDTPASLWQQICREVEQYFHLEQFRCADVDAFLQTYLHQQWPRVCLLRAFSRSVGVQLALRDYPLEQRSRAALSSDDVIMLHPVVKHLRPAASDANTLFATGQTRISQGALREANWLMMESLNLFNQVYGPLNAESASCNRLLGRLAYVMADYQAAVMYQQRAVLISERVLGVDHPVTGQEFGHLALYYFAMGQFTLALQLLYRSRYLALLSHGENHPDMAMIDTNIGLMLHALEDYDKSLLFLQNALRLNTKFFGANSLKVALSSHLVARTFSFRGDFRQALTLEKDAYSIYKQKLGDANERTLESNECLKHLTEQAVEFAKRIQDISKGKITSNTAFLPNHIQRPSLNNLVDTLNLVNGIFVIHLSPEVIERFQKEMNSNASAVDLSEIISNDHTTTAADAPVIADAVSGKS